MIGGRARLPRGAKVIRPGDIRIVMSEPIPTAGYEPIEETLGPLMDRVALEFETTKRAHANMS